MEKSKMFAHPFSFSGRIRRMEYGLTCIIYSVAYYIVGFILDIYRQGGSAAFALIGLALMVALLWFYFAQGAKRCHDRGNSGWYQIIPFFQLWMLFGEGDDHDNGYGDDPKGRNSMAEFETTE